MDKPERIDCAVRSARQDDQGVPVLPNSVPVLSDGVAFSPDPADPRSAPRPGPAPPATPRRGRPGRARNRAARRGRSTSSAAPRSTRSARVTAAMRSWSRCAAPSCTPAARAAPRSRSRFSRSFLRSRRHNNLIKTWPICLEAALDRFQHLDHPGCHGRCGLRTRAPRGVPLPLRPADFRGRPQGDRQGRAHPEPPQEEQGDGEGGWPTSSSMPSTRGASRGLSGKESRPRPSGTPQSWRPPRYSQPGAWRRSAGMRRNSAKRILSRRRSRTQALPRWKPERSPFPASKTGAFSRLAW